MQFLARNMLLNLCANLIDFLKKIINSEDFLKRNRKSETDFTRTRILTFPILITFLINFVKGSYQDELDNFFKALFKLDVAKRVVTKAALAKARMKLKYQAFVELNQHLVTFFESHFNPRTWHGMRLLAIDGSLVRLPGVPEILRHFGAWHGNQGDPSPMARISQMFDVLNKITVSAKFVPKHLGERELASRQIQSMRPDDLLLLDRGYQAWWLFKQILTMNADFCARVSPSQMKVVGTFFRSGLSEKIFTFTNRSHASFLKCKEKGIDTSAMKLRLIRIQKGKKTVTLLTSLLDTDLYPIEIFYDLYHKRWPVEEDYKTIKCPMEIENFTGLSPLSVYQDFHAKVFSKNLVRVFGFHADNALKEDIVQKKTRTNQNRTRPPCHCTGMDTSGTGCRKKRKYVHKINFTQALSKTKYVISFLFHYTKQRVKKMLMDLLTIINKTTEPIRDGRTFPRNHKLTPRKFFPQYKRTA